MKHRGKTEDGGIKTKLYYELTSSSTNKKKMATRPRPSNSHSRLYYWLGLLLVATAKLTHLVIKKRK
jgi:hypothetical protein